MSYLGRQLNVPASVFEAVADGSITAGSTVVIKSTGKVANVTNQAASNSTPAIIDAGADRLMGYGMAYDSSQNCVLFAYRNVIGNKTCVKAATLSGTTLTFGSEVETDMVPDGRVSIASDGSGGFVLICEDSNQSSKQFALAGTVSGTTVTIGDDAEYSTSTYGVNDIAFDSTSGKFVIVYIDNQNSLYLTAKVVTRSGTGFSLGSAVVISSETYLYGCRCTEDTGALLEQFLAHQHLGALRLRVARLQEYGLQKLEAATTTVAALPMTQAHRRQYLLIVTKKAPLTVKGLHYSLPQPVAVQ
jgi:hypothetical protein